MLSHGANSNISRGPRLSILYQLSSILSQPKWIVKNFLKKSGEIFVELQYILDREEKSNKKVEGQSLHRV